MSKTSMKYDHGKGKDRNWLVHETSFDPKYQGKCEAIFALGNGYLGARASTEESYIGQVRNTFIAGTFNRFDDREVTELPNAADHFGVKILIDGKRFSLENGRVKHYNRQINLRTGVLSRSFDWTSSRGKELEFHFERFVSKKSLHLFGSRLIIKSLTNDVNVTIESGIDGQQHNSGSQHFHEGDKRIYDKKFLQLVAETTESKITFVHNTVHRTSTSRSLGNLKERFDMDRRQVSMIFSGELSDGQSVKVDKISTIHTMRDWDIGEQSVDDLRDQSLAELKSHFGKGYKTLRKESIKKWKSFWSAHDVRVDSINEFDQLAIRFALYHLQIMTPAHDSRLGIAAKGLTGEGYKGHSFWDTELFILPYFTYSMPEVAKNLLIYRFETLTGARKKAKENGYAGAMYPWESAWKDDGEVTPVWGAADILTGKPTKIWSGFIEQHITSDVAFAIWQYYQVTGDEEFMEKYGYEILLDTAIFWSARVEWNDDNNQYHINNVIGPDEYKEHVNNNAFTNYTAHWCMKNAILYAEYLRDQQPVIYQRLEQSLRLDHYLPIMQEKLLHMYLPEPNEDFIIPQSDGFLDLKKVDLSKYKNQDHVGTIFMDYSLDQINQMQVCKQADVVMLLYLLENLFDKDIKKANYNFYEPITLHDSSLSLSTHAVLASDMDNRELSYHMFQKATRIDLGPGMKTSDHGIHAASFGGIWQIIVCGFGGIRMLDGQLRIEPKPPEEINQLEIPFFWQGNQLNLQVKSGKFTLRNSGDRAVVFNHKTDVHEVAPNSKIKISL